MAREKETTRMGTGLTGRRLVTALLLGVVGALVAGCAGTGSSAGAATSASRPATPRPTTPGPPAGPPQAGRCYTGGGGTWSLNSPVLAPLTAPEATPCRPPFTYEVVSVGAFPAQVPGSTGPDQPSTATALMGCEQPASDYLGGDWHGALVGLLLIVPGRTDWPRGSHWYACALAPGQAQGVVATSTGSMRDGLRGDRPWLFSCLTQAPGSPEGSYVDPVDCDQPHYLEYVGTYRAPAGDWPGGATLSQLGNDGCLEVLARYLGFASASANTNSHVAVTHTPPTRDQWTYGLRDFRCLAESWPEGQQLVGSMRSIRNKAPGR